MKLGSDFEADLNLEPIFYFVVRMLTDAKSQHGTQHDQDTQGKIILESLQTHLNILFASHPFTFQYENLRRSLFCQE